MARRQDNTPEYTYWRKAVYKRDGHKCKLCGKKGRLNAHHIDGWNWAAELRYAIPNGVTLCGGRNGCHNNFHKQYGKGDNTRYQFDEFLKQNFNKSLLDLDL
jgi:predicted restriction endonuclease